VVIFGLELEFLEIKIRKVPENFGAQVSSGCDKSDQPDSFDSFPNSL
jgi:hypothetical protein